MAAPVDQKANISYTTTNTNCCCDLKEENFCLYAHQYTTGPDPSEVIPNSDGLPWGWSRSDDWPLLDGQGPNAKEFGRVQGEHMLFRDSIWNANFTIVFKDDKYKGSTLQVRGEWVPENPFEWSILGGTGQFTLAQGIVYGKTVGIAPFDRWMQLCFQVFYRPIVKPNMA